jgi:hypothetical protein
MSHPPKLEFEIEHWPSYFGKHTMIRMFKGYLKVYVFFGLLFVVAFGLYFFSKIFLGFPIPYTRFATQIAVYGMLIAPFIPAISYLQRNKKYPSYGINKDGFLINERGWNVAFFGWDESKTLQSTSIPE